jgi:hypothetical protein
MEVVASNASWARIFVKRLFIAYLPPTDSRSGFDQEDRNRRRGDEGDHGPVAGFHGISFRWCGGCGTVQPWFVVCCQGSPVLPAASISGSRSVWLPAE